MKNPEEQAEELAPERKKHFEILVSEISMRWKSWGELRKCELTNSLCKHCEKVMLRYKSSLHRQELQERVIYMNGSREFQDIESICSGKLSHAPSQPAVAPSPRSMLSRDQSLQPDTWNLSGTHGNFFGNPRAMLVSSQIPFPGTLHSTDQSAKGEIPVQRSTGRPVAKGEEQTGSRIPMPSFARRPSTMNSFSPAEISQNSRLVSRNCKSRSFILVNSPHRQRFHVGR